MATIESVQTSLRTADDWLRKGQPAWASKCLSSALLGYLKIAVAEQSDPTAGVAFLASQDVANVLESQLNTLQALDVEVAAGRLPSSVIAGNYHPLVYAHMAWCLEKFNLGEAFVGFAERKDVGDLGTPFWREYARGMGALVRGESFQLGQLRTKGQEKYWIAYLHLIQAACNGQNVDDVIVELDKQFAARNNDKNIKDDAYQIEGSGNQPVKWDFRRQGLLTYLNYRIRR
jgi:hypothetical protein